MKILETRHVREADSYTIENEPISSIDLMERASAQLFQNILSLYPKPIPVSIFIGPGNNGGDGIAVSRMLVENNYPVQLCVLDLGKDMSPDSQINYDRLPLCSWLKIIRLDGNGFPNIDKRAVVVDALFGSGLRKPLTGFAAEIVKKINNLPNRIIAIDIPSGLFGEDNTGNDPDSIIKADVTLTLHAPKLAFFMPENDAYVGDCRILPIGLNQRFVSELPALGHVLTADTVSVKWKRRSKYAHKGTFGHALLVAGSKGKFGAAALASLACLRSGAGLLTSHVPADAKLALHSFVPEAMLSLDRNAEICSLVPDLLPYNAMGIGPGIGVGPEQNRFLRKLIELAKVPMVIDADGLNILASDQELLGLLPANTILTPHPGEFARLFGDDENHFKRVERLKKIAKTRELIIVLKGAHTVIACPGGKLWFNNTGNPGMATAGSGDVLTGIILSLLAQRYSQEESAILAVFLHGQSGDIAVDEKGQDALIARDLIDFLGSAILNVLKD